MSRGIADAVIRDLRLADRRRVQRLILIIHTGARSIAFMGARGTAAGIVERYYSRLNVYEVGTSRVIAVEFSSRDPVLARDAANRIADRYIEQQRQAQLDANARSRAWLAQQIDTLRKRVADSEEKVENYRATKGLLEGAGVLLQAQQLTGSQHSAFGGACGAHRGRSPRRQSRKTGERQRQSQDAAAEVHAGSAAIALDPTVAHTRSAAGKRDMSELSAQLLPTHPTMVQKQAELDNLDQQDPRRNPQGPGQRAERGARR